MSRWVSIQQDHASTRAGLCWASQASELSRRRLQNELLQRLDAQGRGVSTDSGEAAIRHLVSGLLKEDDWTLAIRSSALPTRTPATMP